MRQKLTARQIQIIELIFQGKTGLEIALQLDVSPATVKSHMRIIYDKMDIPQSNRCALCYKALQHGYLTPPALVNGARPRETVVEPLDVQQEPLQIYSWKRLRLCPEMMWVKVEEKQVHGISNIGFKLLHFFLQHPNKIYSRQHLLDNVWSKDAFVEERVVDATVRRVREVLAPYGYLGIIQTVRGVGYRHVSEGQS